MEEKQDVFMISKCLHTNYLLITYGKTVILQWRNLMDTTFPKWSKSMSPAMGQANSMQRRAQQHLDISIKNSGSNQIVRKCQSAKWRNALACDLRKWTGEQTQRLGNVPAKEGETWPPNAGVLLEWTPEWKIISSIYRKGYWGELWQTLTIVCGLDYRIASKWHVIILKIALWFL